MQLKKLAVDILEKEIGNEVTTKYFVDNIKLQNDKRRTSDR